LKEILHKTPNLDVVEASVEDLCLEERTQPGDDTTHRITGCFIGELKVRVPEVSSFITLPEYLAYINIGNCHHNWHIFKRKVALGRQTNARRTHRRGAEHGIGKASGRIRIIIEYIPINNFCLVYSPDSASKLVA
jgi:hypothetical protein